MHRLAVGVGIMLTVLAISCAPSQGRPTASGDGPTPGTAPTENRTLVLAHRYEPANLASKVLQSNGTDNTTRLFNASLSLIDDQGVVQPYLAESLPRLNTDTWRVEPDGRMQTTYTLRKGLTWQDGAPLTADDFVFAYQVYTARGLPGFISTPQDAMESVTAQDSQTVFIQWKMPNPLGGSLGFTDLDPLPRHALEKTFSDFTAGQVTSDAFMSDPFWTSGYIGAGPYRLDHWDPGVQLEATAFPGHVLGGPKIDKLVVKIFLDENQTLATILAGDQIDYACCNTLRFQQFVTLKREWENAGKGTAVAVPGTAVFLTLQQRPDYVGDDALLDPRVRRALAHAIDRQAINEGVFESLGAPTESPVPPNLPYSAEVDRLMTKYSLDPRETTMLMTDAGFSRDANGSFAHPNGKQVNVDFAVQAASEIQQMQTILSNSWTQAGFTVRDDVIDPRVFSQLQTRHTLPGFAYSFYGGEEAFVSTEIGTSANRWRGRNRSGWVSPDYDRVYDAWRSELDAKARGGDVAQMIALVTDNVIGVSLYFSQGVITWGSDLHGPTDKQASKFGTTSRATTPYFDIEKWTFAS